MQSAGFAARLARACHPLRPGWGLNRQHSFGRLALAHRASAKGRPASAGPTASSACSYSTAAGLRRFLRVSDEVAEGVASNKPVVALESTIYTHGAMDEDLGLENIVRRGGGIPAVCGILDGVPTVGLTPEELARMVDSGTAKKVSRRDISYMTGLVGSYSLFVLWPCLLSLHCSCEPAACYAIESLRLCDSVLFCSAPFRPLTICLLPRA